MNKQTKIIKDLAIRPYTLSELKQLRKTITDTTQADDIKKEKIKDYEGLLLATIDKIIKTKKDVACRLSNPIFTLEGLRQQRKEFSDVLQIDALTEEEKHYYQSKISKLDERIKNPSLAKEVQGIDSMMCNMIQLRGMLSAFQAIDENHPFIKTIFFKSYQVGLTYAIFSIFSKLMDTRNDVDSLAKIWGHAYQIISFKAENTELINKWITSKKRTITYRNKIVIHNDQNFNKYPLLKYSWEEFDNDLKQLIETWGILSKFSESFILFPLPPGEKVFHDLGFIKHSDRLLLTKHYNSFISKLETKNVNLSNTMAIAIKPSIK